MFPTCSPQPRFLVIASKTLRLARDWFPAIGTSPICPSNDLAGPSSSCGSGNDRPRLGAQDVTRTMRARSFCLMPGCQWQPVFVSSAQKGSRALSGLESDECGWEGNPAPNPPTPAPVPPPIPPPTAPNPLTRRDRPVPHLGKPLLRLLRGLWERRHPGAPHGRRRAPDPGKLVRTWTKGNEGNLPAANMRFLACVYWVGVLIVTYLCNWEVPKGLLDIKRGD